MFAAISNPEFRRGIRTIVQALVQFALLAFVYSLIDDLHGDAESLRQIALVALAIIAADEVGYCLENGARALKLSAGRDGVTVDASGSDANA
jgi:hypothetical protein